MKMFIRVMLSAVAVIAFFGCQKSENTFNYEDGILTFLSTKPEFNDATRTEWRQETVMWSQGDQISVAYTVDGVWQKADGNATGDAKIYKSKALTEASEQAKFNVSAYFTGTISGTHVFYGVYPVLDDTDFRTAPTFNIEIPSVQNPKPDSFDSAADLMVGVSKEYDSRPDANSTITMVWSRLVAHADLTLKSINGLTNGEIVKRVRLTAQEGANLVGDQTVDIITGEVVKKGNVSTNIVELDGSNLSIGEGNLNVWACFLPVTLTSLMVEIETDKAYYTRTITGINKEFKQNARNVLAVNMSTASREEKAEVENYSGEWLITGTKDAVTYAANAFESGKSNLNATQITISGDVIDHVDGIENCKMLFTRIADGNYAGLYTIEDASGKYLYAASSTANQLKSHSDLNNNSYWRVDKNQDGTYSIVASKSTNRNVMQFYYTVNSKLFNCYQSASQTAIVLYPYSMVGSGDSGEEGGTEGGEDTGDGGDDTIKDADSYSYEFTAKTFTTNPQTEELGKLSWTLSGDSNYFGNNNQTKGPALGKADDPFKNLVLSTNECVGLVNVVKVNASGANNVKATLNVTVNNVSYGTVDLTSTATEYTFEAPDGGAATGEIVLTITQTSSVALYIKSISIN